jgi:hypothetical protein
MLTDVRRLCGQSSGAPSGVADQATERIMAPIAPPRVKMS